MLQAIKNTVLLMRPYSMPNIIALAILANVFALGKLILDETLLRDAAIGVLVWILTVFLLEMFHMKIDNRKVSLLTFIFSLLVVIILLYQNIYALLILCLLLFFDFIYSLKTKNWFLSPFVFIFRGCAEIGILSIILILHNQNPIDAKYFLLLAPVFFITVSRNMIGDIRDIERDRYTFPKKFGITTAYAVSATLLLVAFLLLQDFFLIFPLTPAFLMLLLRWNAYFTHSFFVVSTLFFTINYSAHLIGYNSILIFLLFLGFLLYFTYGAVPRKSGEGTATI